MNENVYTGHFTVDVRISKKEVVATTIVAMTTILALKTAAHLVKPPLRKFIESAKTEIDKWSPPAE